MFWKMAEVFDVGVVLMMTSVMLVSRSVSMLSLFLL